MSDNTVDIAVRWAEAGGDIPAKTTQHLNALKASAGGASTELGDRLSSAFVRLESREPTMVLRRARFALEELTASAVGFTGPGGRLAASFAMLGGATATAAVAGVAAIGMEVKTLLGFSDDLEQSLEKLNMQFANLGGAGATGLMGAAQVRNTPPGQPSWILRLAARIGDFFTMPGEQGDLSEAITTGMDAEAVTRGNAARLMTGRVDRQHAEERRRRHEQMLRDELRRLKEADLGVIQRQPFHTVTAAGGFGTTVLPSLQGFQFGGGLGEAALAAHAGMPSFAAFGTGGLGTHPIFGSERNENRAEQIAERNAEKMATVIGREIGPAIQMFAGGGARGAVAGLGGISGTLASLNDPTTGKALLGTLAPGFSLASGLLSGVSALFGVGGQKPKVEISAFVDQAIQQIKELRADPLTTQIVVIGATGADPRSIQQMLGRLSRLGVITRFP